MNRAKLDAFIAAAADLGMRGVNYIAPDDGRERPIVSIDAGSRALTMVVASALGMPTPRELDYNGRRWLSSTIADPGLYLDVRSTPEDHPTPAIASTEGATISTPGAEVML